MLNKEEKHSLCGMLVFKSHTACGTSLDMKAVSSCCQPKLDAWLKLFGHIVGSLWHFLRSHAFVTLSHAVASLPVIPAPQRNRRV